MYIFFVIVRLLGNSLPRRYILFVRPCKFLIRKQPLPRPCRGGKYTVPIPNSSFLVPNS